MWESLFADEEGKDVELMCIDGSVRSHSLLLKQMSEPLKAMLTVDMKEKRSNCIQMPNYNMRTVKFILRFLYTGQVDDTDFQGAVEPVRAAPSIEECIEEGLAYGDVDFDFDNLRNEAAIPLDVMLSAASFAQQYQMISFQSFMLEQLKSKLSSRTFETVLGHAIQSDMTPLKLACLKYAEANRLIRKKFQEQMFSAPVQFELLALWPEPPKKKTRRVIT